jgi:hypothetical protein
MDLISFEVKKSTSHHGSSSFNFCWLAKDLDCANFILLAFCLANLMVTGFAPTARLDGSP